MGILDKIYSAGQTPGTDTTGKKIGILQAIGSVLAPKAGSFVNNAMSNPNGIFGADQYGIDRDLIDQGTAQKLTAGDIAIQGAQDKVDNPFKDDYHDPTGAVLRRDAKGVYTPVYTPPPTLSTPEKVAKAISVLQVQNPNDPMIELLKRSLPGYASSPEVIAAKGVETRKTNAAKPRPLGRAAVVDKLPQRFTLDK